MSITTLVIGYFCIALFVLGCLPYTHEDDWRLSTRNVAVEIFFACAWPLMLVTAAVACVVFTAQAAITFLRRR